MKKLAYFIIILAMMAPFSVNAQKDDVTATEKLTIPPGPMIQDRAPEFAKWQVIVASKAISKPKTNSKPSQEDGDNSGNSSTYTQVSKPRPKAEPQMTVTKTKHIYQVRRVDSYNQVSKVWSDGKTTTMEPTDRNKATFVTRSAIPDQSNRLWVNFSKSDFEGFDWISEKNYKGIHKYKGTKCLLFTDTVMVERAYYDLDGKLESPAIVVEKNAFINLESRLPVVLEDPESTITYKFLKPPTAMQTLPASITNMLDEREKFLQKLRNKIR